MTKTIKQTSTDLAGNTLVEYSDGTFHKYNPADAVSAVTDSETGDVSLWVHNTQLSTAGSGGGATGPRGATGATGAAGLAGTNGVIGSNGKDGLTGATGSTGLAGTNGTNGTNGTSVALKGAVAALNNLPTANNTAGDLWVVTLTGDGYVWGGTSWSNVGPIRGPTGATGAAGIAGLKGDTGLTGLAGTQGVAGAKGTDGIIGSNGAAGAQGTVGATGANGVNGTNGTNGTSVSLKGSVAAFLNLPSSANSAGDLYVVLADGNGYVWSGSVWTNVGPIRGPSGEQGLQGLTGLQGSVGTTGSAGATGVTGLQGIQGTAGVKGDTGLQGLTGSVGAVGATGLQGLVGNTGLTGSAGISGVDGVDGSAGAKGTDGVVGSNGSNGLTGAQGATGATGSQGLQGLKGDTGAQGIVGQTGLTGAIGLTGTVDTTLLANEIQRATEAEALKADKLTTYTKTEANLLYASKVSGTGNSSGTNTGDQTLPTLISLNATPQVLTTSGDIAYMGAGGIMQRLPASLVDNQVLTNHPNGVLSWQASIPGQNATVNIGTITTIASGGNANVTNSGDSLNATLNFSLPQGPAGIAGLAGSNSLLIAPFERWSVSTSARANLEVLQLNIRTASVFYFANAAVGSFSLNLRGDSSTAFSTLLAVNDCCTVVVANTCAGTPYFPSAFSIDGVQVYPKWSGGLSPNAGNSNSVDFYAYVIARTAAGYSIFANQTKYA